MILKKRLKKSDNGLEIKINQMQAYYSGKKLDYKSVKINNNIAIFQEQRLEPYSKFISRKFLIIEKKCRPWQSNITTKIDFDNNTDRVT